MMKLLKILIILLLFSTPSYAFLSADGSAVNGMKLSCGTTDDILTENGPMSISVWAKISNSGGSGNGRIVVREANLGRGPMFYTPGATSLEFGASGTTDLKRTTNTGVLTPNVWQNLVVTWDGSTTASNVHIYVNGVEATYLTTTNGASLTNNLTADTVVVNRADSARTLGGQIDDLAIWSSVLSQDDIKKLSNTRVKGFPLQISPQTLKRYFPLDDASDNSQFIKVIDKSSFRIDCTPSNNARQLSEVTLSYT